MTKVISFEKFSILQSAGLNEREARELHHMPQMHSVSDSIVQSATRRAAQGRKQSGLLG